MRERVFAQDHRQRVRLLARRAARAPHQDRPDSVVAALSSGRACDVRNSKCLGSRKKSVLLVVTTSMR